VPPSIAGRLAEVRERIGAAARSAGRAPETVRLVAVSKTFPLADIREAYVAGQRDFGENKVQEGLQKITLSAELAIRWHLLGHLQANKARKAATGFAMIQTVDSLDLLARIDRVAAESGKGPELLIQVDLAGEATKSGAAPADVPRLFEAAAACRAARVVGLMTLPPFPETPEDARPWFVQLRTLRDRWLSEGVPTAMLRELSMGMSADFEVAVQEGATIVRVGTAIFGSRHVQR
jgi:pyridoxal phosphate enzyme (YggS family)